MPLLGHILHTVWRKSCDADPDLWMKPEFRPKISQIIIHTFYVNDILCIHHNPDDVSNKLNVYVLLKTGSVRSPKMYLSRKLKCMQIHNDICTWSMSPSKYVQEAGRICEQYIAKHLSKGYHVPRKAENPFE